MPTYGLQYIMTFENELNEIFEAHFEFKDYVGDVFNIIGGIKSINLRSTTGDEDKLTPILGLECLMQIAVAKNSVAGVVMDDTQLTIADLIAQHDNDIRVTVYKDQIYNTFVFQGFVVVEDNSQPFLDPPFLLSVRALDGLGLLKNQDLVDFNSQPFVGVMSVQNWIGNMLYKTGQDMPLRIYFPLYPIQGGIDDLVPSLEQVCLNAQTFQTGELTTTTDPTIDTQAAAYSNVYDALTAICHSFRCRLFQQDGVWNFVSLYSYVDPNGFGYNESTGTLTDGVYSMVTTATHSMLNYDVSIGKDNVLHPAQDDGMLYLKLATKWIKLNYGYDQPTLKICNQNFIQGDPDPTNDGTISSTIEDPTILPPLTFNYKAFQVYCWTIAGGTNVAGGTTPFPETAQTAPVYTRSVVDDLGYEENRYVVITDNSTVNHIRSQTFLVDINDSLEITLDYRTRVNVGPSDLTPLIILLDGDDGTKWGLGEFSPGSGLKWWLLDSNYRIGGGANFPPLNGKTYISGDSTADWSNLSVFRTTTGTIVKVPVSGACFIVLEGLPSLGGESWFKNLQINVHAYLQGSYVQLKGDYNYSSSTNDIKQTLSEDVEISDSPKRYFKGALVLSNNDLIVPSWHRFGVTESFRFQQIMERLVYNNLYRIIYKFEGTVRGRTYMTEGYDVKEVGYLNRYFFVDSQFPDKMFILTSFDDDLGTGQGRKVYVEVLKDANDSGFVAPDAYLFQYIFQ